MVLDHFGTSKRAFFAVYDGHGGRESVSLIKDFLHKVGRLFGTDSDSLYLTILKLAK